MAGYQNYFIKNQIECVGFQDELLRKLIYLNCARASKVYRIYFSLLFITFPNRLFVHSGVGGVWNTLKPYKNSFQVVVLDMSCSLIDSEFYFSSFIFE